MYVYKMFYIFIYLNKKNYIKCRFVVVLRKWHLFVQKKKSTFSKFKKWILLKILYKRYFNHKTRLNRCRNRIFHEKLHISMYIRHIDHRSGAPWGPHGREGGKTNSRQSREIFFPGKGAPWGAPLGGPHGGGAVIGRRSRS